MRAATLLTRLYPPAVRDRWGAEISHEVSASGIRTLPDTLVGAARLWLHPGDWPETVPGQTRRVLAIVLFTVTAATAILLRAAQPSPTLTADVRHPTTSAWLAPILLGIALGAPLPRLRRDAVGGLTTTAIRTLTAPAAAVLAMFLLAHSGLVEHPSGPAHIVLVVYYWATLGFTALCLCRLIARIAMTARLPGSRRLRTALLLIGAGLALAASQTMYAITRSAPHAGSLALTLTLGLLAAATIHAGKDMRADHT
jgi:hypothetical protein